MKAVIVKASNGDAFESHSLSRRGSTVFNKRTILLVGFMLKKSQVALEVRNQALNVIESATDEYKTMEITKEKEMLMAIMFATNEIERATAINEHIEADNENYIRSLLTDSQWKTFRSHFKACRDDIEQAS